MFGHISDLWHSLEYQIPVVQPFQRILNFWIFSPETCEFNMLHYYFSGVLCLKPDISRSYNLKHSSNFIKKNRYVRSGCLYQKSHYNHNNEVHDNQFVHLLSDVGLPALISYCLKEIILQLFSILGNYIMNKKRLQSE